MPLSERLRSFLDSHQAGYTLTTHPAICTARGLAIAEHLRPREVAKAVVIFGDGAYHMVVIPAGQLVDLSKSRTALGLAQARLTGQETIAFHAGTHSEAIHIRMAW